MNERDALNVLERCGAILRGHFVLTSGRHADAYVNKDAIYPCTEDLARLAASMADKVWYGEIRQFDVVAGPEKGGILLATWVAHWESQHPRQVLAVWAEKVRTFCGQPVSDSAPADGFRWEFRRGYDRIVSGRHVLVVEDVVTTGGSARAAVGAVQACGGTVAGVACLVNRGGVTGDRIGLADGVPFVSLVSLDLPSWEEAECPMCREGVPVRTDVGKGRERFTRMPR